MNNSKNFEEQMSTKTDEELYDLLANKDDYTSEAIRTAEKELRKRGLEPPKAVEQKPVAPEQKVKNNQNPSNRRIGCITGALIGALIGLIAAPKDPFFSAGNYAGIGSVVGWMIQKIIEALRIGTSEYRKNCSDQNTD